MKKILQTVKEEKIICVLVLALFFERVFVGLDLGITYNLGSDDLSYVTSGIVFANTGMITMHGVLSAQIMPGMTWLIGLVSLIFGEDYWLWVALKLLWYAMGSISALFVYKSVKIFTPKWCAFVAVIPFFFADFVWMDNLILTETPFVLCLTVMIYATLMMGKMKVNKYFVLCTVAYMAGLMFKANIGVYPVFAMIYLLLVRYEFKRLLKQGVILGCVLLSFIIPWSIRNYIHYDAFIPLTWGSGNPTLLGTYQGYGYPQDSELDYITNVEQVAEEKFAKYYNEDGSIKADYLIKYISLEKDGIKASYRMTEWWKSDSLSMIISYIWYKPKYMIHHIFYWQPILDIEQEVLYLLKDFNLWICMTGVVASAYLKKYRAEMFFLLTTYLGNIYIYAMTYAFGRYGASLMSLRYIMSGVSIYLIIKMLLDAIESVRKYDRRNLEI